MRVAAQAARAWRSVPFDLGHVRSPRGTGSLLRWSTPRSPLPWPYAPATGPRGGWTTLTWARREHGHEFTRQRVYVVPVPVPGQDDGDVRRGAATSPDRAELPPLHHSAGSVTARYLRCSVRVLSGARGKAGPPWNPAVPRDESRWPCAGGSITSLHTTRPVSRPAALPACSPRPRTWPDPTDQHRPSRSRLSSRSGHRRRLTSRQAHAQSRSVATWRSYRRPHAAATPPQPAGFSSCHRPRRCAAQDAGQFLSYEADPRRAIAPESGGGGETVIRRLSLEQPFGPVRSRRAERHFLSRWHLLANARQNSEAWNCSAWSRQV